MKLKSAICLLVSASVNACGSPNPRWSEEVQLSDGRVIVVERGTLNEPGGDEWAYNRAGVKPMEYRICFAIPDASGSTVEWRPTKKSSQTWPEIPLVFDIENGRLSDRFSRKDALYNGTGRPQAFIVTSGSPS